MKYLCFFLGLSVGSVAAQTITFAYDARGNTLTKTNQGNLIDTLKVQTKAFLLGPYATSTGQMNDALRSKNLLPVTEPYSASGYTFLHGGGEVVSNSVFLVSGANAIVDWVIVELRDAHDRSKIISSRAALIQRDGDIVDLDGISPVKMAKACNGEYYIGIRHRNHLGVMNLNAFYFATTTGSLLNFTTSGTPTFGTNAQKALAGGITAMWGGNANGNTSVRATGPASINDYTHILSTLGTPTAILNNVYIRQDVNMDGILRVTGPAAINDYSALLNFLGVPTNIVNSTF